VILDGYIVPSRKDDVAFNRCIMKSLWVDFFVLWNGLYNCFLVWLFV